MSENTYEKNARKKSVMEKLREFDSIANQSHATKGQWLASAGELAKDLLIGVGAGALLAKITSPASFYVGLPITYAGYMLGSRSLTSLGLGTMSYGVVSSLGMGAVGGKTTMKEKFHELGQEFKQRLLLDKMLKSKKADTSTPPATTTPVSGTEKVRYFMYPDQGQVSGPGDLDMSALERLNAQVEQSARAYKAQNPEPRQSVSGLAGALQEMMNERIM